MKDVDRVLLPQDPSLDHKFPRPVTERSHCGGIWEAMEEDSASLALSVSILITILVRYHFWSN